MRPGHDFLMSYIKRNGNSKMRFLGVILFLVLTVFGFILSAYLILNASTVYMYVLAVLFLVLSTVSGLFNIATSYWYYRSYFYGKHLRDISKSLRPMTHFPTVAIAMPTFNEDPAMVEKNMLRLKSLNYPKGKLRFYLLDDSTDDEKGKELAAFSRRNNIVYLHRDERRGYKAGALNNMLRGSGEEFVAIFDYDEYLTNRNFLLDTMPYFQDDELSYIQTEKRYSNGTFFSETINLFDGFFFKFVQPARALNNTAIFAGSCGVIRRKALDVIGGFPEYVIEDTFFSFESDINKYKSLYLPRVYALGKPIRSFSELAKQQWRYNYGDTQFLRYFIERKTKSKKLMSTLSKIDYMTHGFGLNYLSSVLLLFTITSILIVFSTYPISHISIRQLISPTYLNMELELFGMGALIISIITPILLTKLYFGSAKKGFMVFLVNFALVFVRTKAALSAVLNLNPQHKWVRSSGGRSGSVIAAMQNSAFEIGFAALLFLLGSSALLIDNLSGGLWLLWYGLLYSSTFYFFYRYG